MAWNCGASVSCQLLALRARSGAVELFFFFVVSGSSFFSALVRLMLSSGFIMGYVEHQLDASPARCLVRRMGRCVT